MKKIVVDPERCTGCGMCAAIAPGILKLDRNGKARIAKQDMKSAKKLEEAISACSNGAISCKLKKRPAGKKNS